MVGALDNAGDIYDKYEKEIVQDVNEEVEGILEQVQEHVDVNEAIEDPKQFMKDLKRDIKEQLEKGVEIEGVKIQYKKEELPKDDSQIKETINWNEDAYQTTEKRIDPKGLRPDA